MIPKRAKINQILLRCSDAISIITLLILGVTISLDTFQNKDSFASEHYMTIQLTVSLILIVTLLAELILSDNKLQFLKSRFLFLLVCIPYLNIFHWLDIQFSVEGTYFLRFIPLLRGGYILMFFVRLYCKRNSSYMLISYLIILLSTLYFFSLIFYVFEYKINPNVNSYADAIWWSAMVASTEGSNIIAITPVGRILTVIETFLGITFFPIFTVYIVDTIKKINGKNE